MSKHDKNEFGAEEDIALDNTAVPTDAVSEIGVTAKEEEARAKKKERADEWARMKANLRNSKEALIALVTESPDFDEQYANDLATLIGKERGTGTTRIKTPRIALRNEFINMFYDGEGENAVPTIGKMVKGMDLFMSRGLGKDKLNLLCAEAIKKASTPELRHWITAVADETYEFVNNYQLVAVGADAPEGWDGFLPNELE